jgi:two-component system, NtrC family, response regulator PilR
MTAKHVLIVDDEADIRELLVLTLMRMGVEAEAARNCEEAYARLKERSFDLCLTDMRLPDGDGLGVLSYIAAHHGNTPVAVITAYGSTDNAVAALKAGAFDYISKPIQLKQLREVITSALNLPKQTNDRNERARRAASSERSASGNVPARESEAVGASRLLGESAPIQRAREMIAKLARSQAPVYITGESGTGKEVAARLIHSGSARRDAPFVAVNCGAIPENLMESEFFGYRKGAFTGADGDKDGFLHAADGGTLFLDEVGDLPLAMQVKLLRVIQEKKVRKLGETSELAVDFRIISATHKNLNDKVTAGEFRQDLFYRLNVIELRMPSLREIPEDIPLMVSKVLERLAQQSGLPQPALGDDAMRALKGYDYPGNVRELENILERALALCDGQLVREADLYLTEGQGTTGASPSMLAGERTMPLHEYLDQIEREQIQKALEQTRFNKTAAAKVLGITFRSLRYRLDRLGIE